MAAQRGQPSDIAHPCSNARFSGLEGSFEKFKNPESTDGSVLAMGKGPRSNSIPGSNFGHSKEPRQVLSDFLWGLLILSIYLGMLQTQYPHEPLPCPWTPPPPNYYIFVKLYLSTDQELTQN